MPSIQGSWVVYMCTNGCLLRYPTANGDQSGGRLSRPAAGAAAHVESCHAGCPRAGKRGSVHHGPWAASCHCSHFTDHYPPIISATDIKCSHSLWSIEIGPDAWMPAPRAAIHRRRHDHSHFSATIFRASRVARRASQIFRSLAARRAFGGWQLSVSHFLVAQRHCLFMRQHCHRIARNPTKSLAYCLLAARQGPGACVKTCRWCQGLRVQ